MLSAASKVGRDHPDRYGKVGNALIRVHILACALLYSLTEKCATVRIAATE